MEIKCNNPKLTQKQLAKELVYSNFRTKRYRGDIKLMIPYRGLFGTRWVPNESSYESLNNV